MSPAIRPVKTATLRAIVEALGGDLYDGGRRANVPAPGHSAHDRSVSLLLHVGRVVVHSFGAAGWAEVLDDLRDRGLIDDRGGPAEAARARPAAAGRTDLQRLLTAGPPEELRVVRRIFRMFVVKDLSPGEIARRLRREGVPRCSPHGWTEHQVRGILANRGFVGELVYGKTRSRLEGGSHRLPKGQWVHVLGVLPKIVPQPMFDEAQRRLAPQRAATDEELLDDLRALVQLKRHVTSRDLGSATGTHSHNVYIRRFGSLNSAYARIGYVQSWARRAQHLDPHHDWFEATLAAEWASPQRMRRSLPTLWHEARARGYRGSLDCFRASTREWEAAHGLRRIRRRVAGLTDVELLQRLTALLAREGRVSTKLIDADDALPSPLTVYKRFGGLRRAYELIGYLQPTLATA